MSKNNNRKSEKEAITVKKVHPMVCIIEKVMQIHQQIVFLLLSDIHFDHPACDRELLKVHIEECIAKDGYILINGDFFCVMQGKYDKRHNKSDVRPENMVANYFDSIVDDAVEFFKPYAERILFMGYGNHETSILKRTETDLLQRFIERIYYETNHRISLGEYHGFIWIKAYVAGNLTDRKRMSCLTYALYHNHGTGGEAPVTGGSIEDNRKQTQIEGMDGIWMGHNHNKYTRQVSTFYLDKHPQSVKPRIRIIDIIRSGTYKQEYKGKGFHIETNKAPKPLGGVWLTLTAVRGSRSNDPKRPKFLSSSVVPTWHEPIDL